MRKSYFLAPIAAAAFVTAIAVGLLMINPVQNAHAASGNIRVNPATQTASAPNVNFNVTLVQNADVATTGAQADFTFNKNILEILSVTLGSGYTGGSLVAGTSGQTVADAITSANSSGTLENVAAFLIPPSTVPAGDANFVVIQMRGKICGSSALTLTNLEMLDASSTEFTPTATNGTAISGSAVDFNAPFGVQDWLTPVGDNDCDGFTDANEAFLGTDAAQRCSATSGANNEPTPDRWPIDFDDNQLASLTDVTQYSSRFGAIGPNPPYAVRFDFNQDNRITLVDVTKFSGFFGRRCV